MVTLAKKASRATWPRPERRCDATYGELERRGQRPRLGESGRADDKYSLIRDPDHLLVIAGGEGAGWSAIILPWAGGLASLPVTKEIKRSR